ncbi:MAG: hypothetical protein Q9227_005044 [Pyrenula ochraceoflavens]
MSERPIHSEDKKSKWGLSFVEYIDFSKTVYQIYEQLLSARAQQEPVAVRVQRVHEFAANILQIKDKLATNLKPKEAPTWEPGLEYSPVDIGFSSVLTSVYWMLPLDDQVDVHPIGSDRHHPPQFHNLCVQSGRAALHALVCARDFVSNELDAEAAQASINWMLLFAPFLPYLAVFSNQIATGSREDLLLLRNVVEVVEAGAKASYSLHKLCTAFSLLFRIAELWTSKFNSSESQQNHNLPSQSVAIFDEAPNIQPSGKQPLVNRPATDDEIMAATATELPAMDWQDQEMLQQDLDTVFNEFDLGLGAQSARDMIPWFEQHMSDINTSS